MGHGEAQGMTGPDDDDLEPFVLADGDSASRNTAMIQKLEDRLRALGLDDEEIDDRCTAARERWDAIVMRRAQAWKAWARRRGIAKVRIHTTQSCGGRVETTALAACWRCRLCLRIVPECETGRRDVLEA